MTARPSRLRPLSSLVLALGLTLAVPAQAAPAELGKADAAWHRGELEEAMALYEAALRKGGMEPQEVVLAYSRIGTVKAALKDSPGALSAFRTANTIDPEFELPADSGPLAKKLYEQARAEAAATGDYLALELSAPEAVRARREFQVATVIPEAFTVLVSEVELHVEDEETGKKWKKAQPVAAQLEFKVPGKMAIAGATLTIRARALDERRNTWVIVTRKVEVEGERQPSGMDSGREVSPFEEPAAEPTDKGKKDEGGGFWAGPAPWIAGGAAVLLGVGAFFLVSSSPDSAKVGAPSWR